MIKIYKPSEVDMDKILATSNVGDFPDERGRWDYPISELDYLVEDFQGYNGTIGYVVYDERLWEVYPDEVKEETK